MNNNRTIIVSNRLPVKVEIQGDEIKYHASEGGLATGLSSVRENGDTVWIGWSGIATRNLQLQCNIDKELKKQDLISIMLCEQEIKDFYEGFSNETLWPLFHYFPSYAQYSQEQWNTYVSVNQKFADAIVDVASPNDTIWIHDYHLLLVPSLVRDKMPSARIGFFQHIPFPSFEVFRLLPWRNELLKGLLGADLIGFHTNDDVFHFMECIEKITEVSILEASVFGNEILLNTRTITVEAFPMGIDFDKHKNLAIAEGTQRHMDKLRELTCGKKMIVSVDRLDYSKGILHRLKAYEQFLVQHPEMHEQVVFTQLIVPSRDTVQQYGSLKEDIDRLVGDINAKYGTLLWQPICYLYRSLTPQQLSALYTAADVAMVTPLRDGMNLVSKEYVASKILMPGVLILSEMAGAAQELTQAVIVNPNDCQEVAEAIYTSLIMPLTEQVERMKAMQQTVAKYDVHLWANRFMSTLMKVSEAQNIFNDNVYHSDLHEFVLSDFMAVNGNKLPLGDISERPRNLRTASVAS